MFEVEIEVKRGLFIDASGSQLRADPSVQHVLDSLCTALPV